MGVMLLSICLDCDAVIDHEINVLRVAASDLRHNDVATEPQSCSDEALRQAVACPIRPVANWSAILRKTQQQPFKIDLIERLGSQCPVKRGYGRFEALVEYNPIESIAQSDGGNGSPFADLDGVPVENHTAGFRGVKSHSAIFLRTKTSGVRGH